MAKAQRLNAVGQAAAGAGVFSDRPAIANTEAVWRPIALVDLRPFAGAVRPTTIDCCRTVDYSSVAVAMQFGVYGMQRLLGISVLAIATVFGGGALAKSTEVPAGRTSRIGDYAIFSTATCAYAKITKATASKSKNGAFKAVAERVRIPAGRKCAGKTIPGYAVFYTPKAGFHGRDCGKVVFFHPDLEGESQNYGHPFPVCVTVR